jgi:hypothetical protein
MIIFTICEAIFACSPAQYKSPPSEAFVLVNQRNQHFAPKAETAIFQTPRRLKDKICLGSL